MTSTPTSKATPLAQALSQTAAPRPAGDLAIWLVIAVELLTFALLFLAYAVQRTRHVVEFNASQHSLDLNAGAINTVLLITGSWCVARAVRSAALGAANHNAQPGAGDGTTPQAGHAVARWLLAALLCGAGFIGLKLQEYGHCCWPARPSPGGWVKAVPHAPACGPCC